MTSSKYVICDTTKPDAYLRRLDGESYWGPLNEATVTGMRVYGIRLCDYLKLDPRRFKVVKIS